MGTEKRSSKDTGDKQTREALEEANPTNTLSLDF